MKEDFEAAELELPQQDRDRITAASQLPAYYPLWHRMMTAQDRPEPAEAEYYRERAANVFGEQK